MVRPARKVNIVKKRTKPFVRVQSDRFKRVPTSWRRPVGIDSRTRRRFKGTRPHAKIGYGSNKSTRFLLPDGFRKFTIHNKKDLESLLMLNRTYAAEIAHNVGAKKRIELVERAKQLSIKVINADARVRAVEN
ncbi:60S ribosomal protein L32 [Coemansia sp. RSA 1694]|uniref:60S ribosomal protein L32 n=4 Tax=Coemansia TaxID=4863 RepID=A0A9W8GJ83_9FUNG|nr:60S ribosomal protein L32 [Coemansia sp. RSA 25]KAJ1820456.1 60S ribosomal protein L32 [Coemansia sp. RSA 2675]KAJ2009177.1 60S ribosomal protein L32 [Coemansia sp. S85]KAJ2015373.1 60S ribosomal protein L32 [Coemansia sp. S610]KAJ2331386.1 60S ribosomal protein L32 [Coemansia sp. RSA 2681]KAJ2349066.1 60S ribosomal protein L32 [Coemansia sp. RSA 2671]KAJ2414131.1 60S ribosomal protein L32 [Coemansia sp. RSA 2530]KAJ2491807.1 60S ribosomal protein L32 [Coemansia sp. RSA 2050]KAJ2509210.1